MAGGKRGVARLRRGGGRVQTDRQNANSVVGDTDTRSPVPHDIDVQSPVPHDTDVQSPVPHDTDVQSPVPHDTDVRSPASPEIAGGHPSQESSNPMNSTTLMDSQGVAPTGSFGTSLKRGRGNNKCLALNALVDKFGPIRLQFDPLQRAPVGTNAEKWSRKIGQIVRNLCDLTHDCWTKVPEEQKFALSNHVQAYFKLQLDRHEEHEALFHALGRAYAGVRTNLHRLKYKIHLKGVKMDDTAAVAMARAAARRKVPRGLGPEKWNLICESFEIQSWMEKSERNAKNRSQLKTNHTAGTCTFINVVHKRKRERGTSPTRVELYKDTHTKKDGTFVDEICEGRFNSMQELINVEGEENMEEIVTRVLGGRRSGHVIGMGCGVIPTPLSSSRMRSSTQSPRHDEFMKKQQETEKRLEDTQNELKETKNALEETKNTLGETKNALEETKNTLEESVTSQAKMRDEHDKTKNALEETKNILEETKNTLEESVTSQAKMRDEHDKMRKDMDMLMSHFRRAR